METVADFNVTVDPLDALQKARKIIENGTGPNSTLRISGVATALANDHGVKKDDNVRARFFEILDGRMDRTGPDARVVDLLRELAREGFRMGIVTFVRRPRIVRRLDIWRFDRYFDSIVTPDDVPEVKPSPAPFVKAMQDLQVRPNECFVIGDEPVDMIGGRKAGAETVGLPRGFFTAKELVNAGANHILSSLDFLPSILPIEARWPRTGNEEKTGPANSQEP